MGNRPRRKKNRGKVESRAGIACSRKRREVLATPRGCCRTASRIRRCPVVLPHVTVSRIGIPVCGLLLPLSLALCAFVFFGPRWISYFVVAFLRRMDLIPRPGLAVSRLSPVATVSRSGFFPRGAARLSPEAGVPCFGSRSFSAAAFLGHGSGIIPAPGGFTASAFPVPPSNSFGSLPECSRSPWEQYPLRPWVPQGNGAEKGETQCIYMLSGIASGRCFPAGVSDIRTWFVLRWPLP
jgi:hypothetical protein